MIAIWNQVQVVMTASATAVENPDTLLGNAQIQSLEAVIADVVVVAAETEMLNATGKLTGLCGNTMFISYEIVFLFAVTDQLKLL